MLPWVRNRLFHEFHRRTLIYTACCEDPALDRQALRLSPADRVLVITSGGCNALDYLLAGAGEVNAVDLNPCQNALLEFKAAAIHTLDYRDFWNLFGTGRYGSESPFAPCHDAADEDDGYVVSFVTDMNADGAPDIVISCVKGTFVFWNEMRARRQSSRRQD